MKLELLIILVFITINGFDAQVNQAIRLGHIMNMNGMWSHLNNPKLLINPFPKATNRAISAGLPPQQGILQILATNQHVETQHLGRMSASESPVHDQPASETNYHDTTPKPQYQHTAPEPQYQQPAPEPQYQPGSESQYQQRAPEPQYEQPKAYEQQQYLKHLL